MITAVSILDNWSLSKRRFQRRTFTGNELFALLICFDITKFVSLSVFTPIEMISPKICENYSNDPDPDRPKGTHLMFLLKQIKRGNAWLLQKTF